MAKLLRLRRGTDTQHTTFTGAEGEVTVNTTNDSLHVHDGATAGGRELARADLSNLPAGTIDNADISSSAAIANSKLATSGVTAGTYGSSSAIPAITVNDRGIVTSATTSAIDSTAITNGTSNVSVSNNSNVTVVNGGTTVGVFQSDGPQFNDNIKAKFGTGSDLQIYHDNQNSIIKDAGTGKLILDSNGTAIEFQRQGLEVLARFNTDGSVQLYHDNSEKLQTTTTGIDVQGTVTCDGLTCDGSATISAATGLVNIKDSNSTGNANLNYIRGLDSGDNERWFLGHANSSNQDLYVSNNAGGQVRFRTSGVDRINITSGGELVPASNNTYDLGSSSLRWRNVYTNDMNLSNEGGANDVDGTWGSWTIQEGEDDLFLLNRRNGKKYKFNLSEVN